MGMQERQPGVALVRFLYWRVHQASSMIMGRPGPCWLRGTNGSSEIRALTAAVPCDRHSEGNRSAVQHKSFLFDQSCRLRAASGGADSWPL